MKVILTQDVKKLGKRGDVIEVADGYGRNVLIKKGLGVEGTQANLNTAAQRAESKAFKSQVAADEAVVMASQLKKVTVEIPVRVGTDGRSFGSVTAKDISETLEKKYGFKLDKKNIKLKEALKQPGDYEIEVWVHPQVTSTIKLKIVAE